jgi:pyruvate dehydrogenase E1 component beta subunit
MSGKARGSRNVSQLVAEAIAQEMELDQRLLVLGEDVAAMGGTFGTTRDLLGRYGSERVIDTPIAEMSFTGMGVGLAMAGYRPLVEIMFADFIGVAFEQIYDEMAKTHFMSGGRIRIPMVLKTAGGCIGSAAQHSQCLWGTIAHHPGMKVVVPSNPYDYKGMLAAALVSDDPVVYIEHKGQLLDKAETFPFGSEVPEDRYLAEIGAAAVVRPGSDLTLATLSATTVAAYEAAEELYGEGIDVEVIDLRSVVPLDVDTVAESVARTGRLLVVDEDYLGFGLSGELVASVVERLGPGAIQQVVRHALPNVPIASARSLEEAVVPSRRSITEEILKMSAGAGTAAIARRAR